MSRQSKGPKAQVTTGWPVMPRRCSTCPFNEDGHMETRIAVMERTGGGLDASQICHHPNHHGKRSTHLCRGHRDETLTLLHRMRLIPEPTDEAFAEVTRSLGLTPPGEKKKRK